MKNNKISTLSLTTITHVTTDQGYLGTCHERSGCKDEGQKENYNGEHFPGTPATNIRSSDLTSNLYALSPTHYLKVLSNAYTIL